MKPTSFVSRTKFALFLTALLAPSFAFASDVTLEKAPPLTIQQASAFPENLARYHFGAEVKALPQSASAAKLELSANSEDRNISEAALLCDDPTVGYQLRAGRTTLLVSLANIENVQNISLENEGARGSLTIAISSANVPADSPEWQTVALSELKDGALLAPTGPGEAKYIRLTFDVQQPGRVAALGVYANAALADFTTPRPRKVSFENDSAGVALIRDSYTDLHLKSRGLYASSGDLKELNKMIDDQPATVYRFAASDAEPTAVIDLGRERTISRISAVYAAQPGSVDFYVLDNLPAEPNDSAISGIQKVSNANQNSTVPTCVKISAKTIAGLKAVGSVVNTNQGRAAINFPATTGRYVMLKWHPATTRGEPFSVAQVAAFGTPHHTPSPTPQETTETTTADESAPSEGKDVADGKSILDNKDIPAEAPEEAAPPSEGPAPGLPGVPPFTFIPNTAPAVPPTSP